MAAEIEQESKTLLYTHMFIKQNEEYYHTYIDRRSQEATKPNTQNAEGDAL
jgi:hypothetical protein